MSGTNKLNFTILHDTSVHLTTGNGVAKLADYGVNNVLIDERASFKFLEKSHERIPMWAIFGSLTMKEASTLQIINSYNNTPSDNFISSLIVIVVFSLFKEYPNGAFISSKV